jgi:hypothetical protein
MDQVALVTEQIQDGRRLVERLVQEGFCVTAACWLKTHDDGQWFLYIASPLVDEDPIKAYRRVHTLVRQMPHPFWVEPFDVKLVSPSSPVAKAALDVARRYPAKNGIHHYAHSRPEQSDIGTEEAYIYPAPVAHPSCQ